MTTVNTVRGALDTAELGTTLMHEHLFLFTPEVKWDFPESSWRGTREHRVEQALVALRAAKDAGVETFLDLTVLGLGRSIEDIQHVASRIDVNIIVSTGYYTYDALPSFFTNRPPGRSPKHKYADIMTELFVRDITEGIGNSGVRAAMLKCCTEEPGVTPNIERVFTAVSIAHRETGVPITTHSNANSKNGLDQQRLLTNLGVDLQRVTIGHSGDTTDLDYLQRLMDAGSYIGMDRFGGVRPGAATDEARIDTVAALCERGYANRMLLSHDAICHVDMRDDWYEEREIVDRAAIFSVVSSSVIPGLRKRGVSSRDIDQMMVENPRAIFEDVSVY